MNTYRGLAVLIGLGYVLLAWSIAATHPASTRVVAIPEAVFAKPFWVVVFLLPGLALAVFAATWRAQGVVLCHVILFAATVMYAFVAVVIALRTHQGYQVAARSLALAACHLSLVIAGPPLDRPRPRQASS